MMVNKIANQRIIISKKAKKGDFKPKNMIDHKEFNISCKKNKKIAFLFWLFSFDFSHIR